MKSILVTTDKRKQMINTCIRFVFLAAFIFFPHLLYAQQGVQPDAIKVPFKIDQLDILKNIKGKLSQHSFKGPVTDNNIEYWIYLPEQYQSTDKRYQVIYHLHGLVSIEGGGWGAEQINDLYEPASAFVIESFDKAVAAKIIEPSILVFPNGYGNTLWSDSKDGKKSAETNFIKELIPHIDSNYRTKDEKSFRVVQGFSMGGFGAFKFGAKFPELFTAAVNYDGALHSWESISTMRKAITTEIYGDDKAYFETHAPWKYVKQNASAIKGLVAFKANVGSIKDFNRNYREHLTSNGLTVEYYETVCSHDLGCLLNETGQDSFAFIAKYLGVGKKN